jgi:hypothetical protein
MATGYQADGSQAGQLSYRDNLVFGFSWLLVMAIGLMPLAEVGLNRSPSITLPTTGAFFIAVCSGILLKRRYSWMAVVLHIYGQIAIWLSLFVMSLAAVLALIGSR